LNGHELEPDEMLFNPVQELVGRVLAYPIRYRISTQPELDQVPAVGKSRYF
jgi:hypothetical protein